ncbi:MAG: hypothetical protein ACOX29_10360 [Bacillota bacterium]
MNGSSRSQRDNYEEIPEESLKAYEDAQKVYTALRFAERKDSGEKAGSYPLPAEPTHIPDDPRDFTDQKRRSQGSLDRLPEL